MKAIKKQGVIFFGNSNYCQIRCITPILLGLPFKNGIILIYTNMQTFYNLGRCLKGSS
jgi:hypothetical protein